MEVCPINRAEEHTVAGHRITLSKLCTDICMVPRSMTGATSSSRAARFRSACLSSANGALMSFGPAFTGADVDFQGNVKFAGRFHALANDVGDFADFIRRGFEE